MYRVFKRHVWEAGAGWPCGYKPSAVPMDSCKTLKEFDTEDQAREYCAENNERWRTYGKKMMGGTASRKQIQSYHELPRYEFTEV